MIHQEKDNKKLELKNLMGYQLSSLCCKDRKKIIKNDGVEKALVNISNNMADIEYDEKK